MRKDLKIYLPETSNISEKANIGDDVTIHSHCWIGDEVDIEDGVKIQAFAFIPNGVTIRKNAFIGPRVTFTNDKCPPSKDAKSWRNTNVGRCASIGAGVVVLPGVDIGNHSKIGAGSVVTKNVPNSEVWMGNPAAYYKLECPYGNATCNGCGRCY